MTDNRPLPIVYVFQYPDVVIAVCRICNQYESRCPDTPTHRQTITAELIDWAHAHAAEHLQEPTA